MGVLIFAITFALLLAGFYLHRYGNIKQNHPFVTFSVLIAWCFSFMIVFTLPLDITNTVYRQCIFENGLANETLSGKIDECQKPYGMISDDVLINLWRIIYWTSQFLTWLAMPLMQSYLKAGDFTRNGKLKSALIDNAIYYGSYLFICGILLIYIACKGVSLDGSKLKAIASSASNTWGLFLLVLLLGYALVEVPRSFWNNSKPGFTLQYAYFKAAKLSSEKAEAEENVDDILESLQAISKSVPNNHELRPCVETILRKVPIELQERAYRNFNRSVNSSSTIMPSEKALIRIHKQVIKSLQTLQRSEALWSVQVETVFNLEDVARNMHSSDRRFKSEFQKSRHSISRLLYSPVVEWYWECIFKYPFLKALCFFTGILSVMVVWSELTFFNIKPVLSIFAVVLNVAKNNYDFLTIEIFSMMTLCFLCYCAYSTVLRIRFLNLYYLAPHHQTNEHSLIFSGMMLCRLTPPMCLNFLGLVHMDSHIIKERIQETHYSQVMGHMDVIGIIADGFNIYFPMCMLAFCLATWFSLGSRLLSALGFQQFLQNETIAIELVQEGKDLIAREKRRRQRAEEALARRGEGPSLTNSGKYRPFKSGFGERMTPSDGLLRDAEPFDYSTTTGNRPNNEMTRSLSEEITDRFGLSTQIHVGFAPRMDSDNEETRIGPAPRNLFDDV